ncbi:MAG: hypothetical protein ABIN20_05270 [candidate division WOR-3 bacterium]
MNEIFKILEEINKLEERREPEKIFEYLSYPSFLVRERAAMAIARTGRHLREKVLHILLKGYWFEKGASLIILGEWANENDINIIINFLDDKNSYIMEKAALSLYKMLKKLPTLPQNFDPNILKRLYQIFISLQKTEYAEDLKKTFKEFFN